MLNTGEQCDDGNRVDTDTCPNDCKYTEHKSAVRGNRKNPQFDKTGCQVEWYVVNPSNPKDKYQLPSIKQVCVDGNPTCDFSAANDGLCRFKVVLCLNNNDDKLGACVPNGITGLFIRGPRPDLARTQTLRTVLATDVASVQNAVQHLLNPFDQAAGYVFAPPLSATQLNFCSKPFDVDVLLAGLKKRSVKVRTLSINASFPRERIDLSTLELWCKRPPF